MGDMLTLVMARSDGTLGPKVRKWSGTCPSVDAGVVSPGATTASGERPAFGGGGSSRGGMSHRVSRGWDPVDGATM